MKINKLFKKLVIVGVVVILGISLIVCGGNLVVNKLGDFKVEVSILDKDELVIGLDDIFVLMGFKDDSGELVGFDVDFVKVVGEKFNKKIKF